MAAKAEGKITCTVELTPGAEGRLADALFVLYRQIKKGEIEGPLMEKEKKKGSA